MSTLGSFTTASTDNDTFYDSKTNDIMIKASSLQQSILLGCSSNIPSIVKINSSNISIGWSNIILSNLGSMNVTSNAVMNKMLYASNVYVGTPTSYQHSNYMMYISGNGRIEGDLIVNGTITNVNTNVNVTDQFYVNNIGTGTALIVDQQGTYDIAEFQQNGVVTMKIDRNKNISLGEHTAEAKLDINGNSIIRGNILCSNIYTSNIYTTGVITSNLVMGDKLIIDEVGIIINSNYIPSLDSTKIIGGNSSNLAFSSNFIRDRNIITSKISSNISLGGFIFTDGYMNIGSGTSNYNSFRLQINDGDIMIKGSNNFNVETDQARINIGDPNFFISACKGVGLLFQTSNTSYPFMIENKTGNIGIGTVDPKESLHVVGNAKISSNIYILNSVGINTSNCTEVLHVNLGNGLMESNLYVMNSLSISSSNPSETFEVYGAKNAKFGSNVYVMNALSINTSNPSQRLHIKDGSIIINETRSNTNSTLYIQCSNFNPFTIEQKSNNTAYIKNEDGDVQLISKNNIFISNSNIEHMRITSTGQIGLGISNISSLSCIHIRDMFNMSNAQIKIENFDGFSLCTGINPGNGNVYLSTECNLNMVFKTNNLERICITSNGLYGLGINQPQSHLHIHSSSNSYEISLRLSDATNTSGLLLTKLSNQDIILNNTTPNSLLFATSNTQRMKIDTEGNIGIGTNNQLYDKLHVHGNIRSISGTLGPIMMLLPPITYTDVPVNSLLVLDNTIEAGNEVSNNTWRPLYSSSSFLYTSLSDEIIQWNYARLLFRGMSMTLSNDNITIMSIQEYNYNRVPQYSNVTETFTVSNVPYNKGYKTIITPWFNNTSQDVRHIAISINSSTYSTPFRFGSVYIQFKG